MATDLSCLALTPKFNAQTASVVEMREFAACVNRVHGADAAVPVGVILTVKIMILVAICVGIFVGWTSWPDEGRYASGIKRGLNVAGNAMASGFACFVALCLTGLGLMFLFTA